MAAFYFPTMSRVVTDDRIFNFMAKTKAEMLRSDQTPSAINDLVMSTVLFFETNMDILEDLISNLKDEDMFEAVLYIARG